MIQQSISSNIATTTEISSLSARIDALEAALYQEVPIFTTEGAVRSATESYDTLYEIVDNIASDATYATPAAVYGIPYTEQQNISNISDNISAIESIVDDYIFQEETVTPHLFNIDSDPLQREYSADTIITTEFNGTGRRLFEDFFAEQLTKTILKEMEEDGADMEEIPQEEFLNILDA